MQEHFKQFSFTMQEYSNCWRYDWGLMMENLRPIFHWGRQRLGVETTKKTEDLGCNSDSLGSWSIHRVLCAFLKHYWKIIRLIWTRYLKKEKVMIPTIFLFRWNINHSITPVKLRWNSHNYLQIRQHIYLVIYCRHWLNIQMERKPQIILMWYIKTSCNLKIWFPYSPTMMWISHNDDNFHDWTSFTQKKRSVKNYLQTCDYLLSSNKILTTIEIS